MEFPSKYIRGISNSEHIDPNGYITAPAFYFQVCEGREDMCLETSINWHDDDEAARLLLYEKKEGSDNLKYKGGIVFMHRHCLDTISKLFPLFKGTISYERCPLPDNIFHGNILLKPGLSDKLMRGICAAIAMGQDCIVKSDR